jgi:hypothetical protein
MSRQVNFYLLSDDLMEIETRVRSIQPFLIIDWRSPTAKPRQLISLDHLKSKSGSIGSFLVRPEDLNDVVMELVPAMEYWVVDTLKSPVIEFSGCYLDELRLRRGRMYFNERYFGEDRGVVSKSDEFCSWAKKVFVQTKKSLERLSATQSNFEYIGLKAKAWLKESDGKLISL